MEDHIVEPFDNGPIPEELWSDYLEGPFETCSVCGSSLSAGPYEIQKVSNKRETILEMAFCLGCSQSLASEYSEESLHAIRGFLTEHLHFSRPPGLCNFCGEPFDRTQTRSVSALCSGQRLILPLIHVCGSCEEAIQQLMSEKTKGAHEDFLQRTLPGVPADLDPAPLVFF